MRSLIMILALAISALATLPAQAQTSCSALVESALAQVGSNCAGLGHNSACYGFGDVSVDFGQSSPTAEFAQPGDRILLAELERIRTTPFDPATGQGGITILNAQANALPGQSVRFVMLGDVELLNAVAQDITLVNPENTLALEIVREAQLRVAPAAGASTITTVQPGVSLTAIGNSPDGEWVRVLSGNTPTWVERDAINTSADLANLAVISADSLSPIQAFQFRTGPAEQACTVAPPSVLIVQTPENFTATIMVNGSSVQVGSTILLRTPSAATMELTTLSGNAVVNAGTPNEIHIQPGTAVSASLNSNGLASGAWGDWRVLTRDEIEAFIAIETFSRDLQLGALALPTIVQPSGVGQGATEVRVPGAIIAPTAPTTTQFPTPNLSSGTPGQALDRDAWQSFEIGAAICPPWIAYHSDSDSDWDIYRLDEGSASSLNLSRGNQSSDIQVSRSADAAWVAFTSDRAGGDNWEIWLGSTDGAQQRRVTFNSAVDINPAWGPGAVIAFESNRDANWELYAFDVAGVGEPRRLTDNPANDIHAAWSPTGDSIYFQSDRDGDWEIYRLDLDSAELTQITDNNVADQSPVLSFGGNLLAWLQENSFGVNDLVLLDLGSGMMRQVTDFGADVNVPVFSLDSTRLIFDSAVDGDYEIFMVTVATGAVDNLTDNPTITDRSPSVQCSTGDILYHSNQFDQQWDIFAFSLDPAAADPITRLTSDPAADIFALSAPLDESASRLGRLP